MLNNKRDVAFTLALFLMLAATVAIWVGYKKISDEVASVKSEVAARKDFIPPLFGSRHVALRQRFALDQISQAEGGFVLVTGDSIVEGMHMPSLAGVPVVNAGMGGAGVYDVRGLLAEVKHGAAVSGVVIAIGVNDAVYGATSSDYFNQWRGALEKAISTAKILAANKVAVSTVIPVEKGKPLGDQYFDPKKIIEINRHIRQVCAETKTTLIDQEPSFGSLASSGVEYTTDGVHLNGEGYRLMKNNIRKAIRW